MSLKPPSAELEAGNSKSQLVGSVRSKYDAHCKLESQISSGQCTKLPVLQNTSSKQSTSLNSSSVRRAIGNSHLSEGTQTSLNLVECKQENQLDKLNKYEKEKQSSGRKHTSSTGANPVTRTYSIPENMLTPKKRALSGSKSATLGTEPPTNSSKNTGAFAYMCNVFIRICCLD